MSRCLWLYNIIAPAYSHSSCACVTQLVTGCIVSGYSAHPFVFVPFSFVSACVECMLPCSSKMETGTHTLTPQTTDISMRGPLNIRIRNDNNTVRVWYFDDDVYVWWLFCSRLNIMPVALLLIRSESVNFITANAWNCVQISHWNRHSKKQWKVSDSNQ